MQFYKTIEARKVREYKMQLAIVQNPHVKAPGELWRALNEASPLPSKPAVFDEAGFERLRGALSQNPRFMVKA